MSSRLGSNPPALIVHNYVIVGPNYKYEVLVAVYVLLDVIKETYQLHRFWMLEPYDIYDRIDSESFAQYNETSSEVCGYLDGFTDALIVFPSLVTPDGIHTLETQFTEDDWNLYLEDESKPVPIMTLQEFDNSGAWIVV